MVAVATGFVSEARSNSVASACLAGIVGEGQRAEGLAPEGDRQTIRHPRSPQETCGPAIARSIIPRAVPIGFTQCPAAAFSRTSASSPMASRTKSCARRSRVNACVYVKPDLLHHDRGLDVPVGAPQQLVGLVVVEAR